MVDGSPVHSPRRRAGLAVAVVLAVSFVVLTWLLKDIVRQLGATEAGDAAANSLLVRDAKGFRLTVGNYSRIGFNHPGPVLLYVLAAGEAVFFDLLGVANSAFGGQMLGLAAWNSGLLALTFRQLRTLCSRQTQSRCAPFTAFVGFLALVAVFEPLAFTGSWFPHVYVLPFALFFVSLAGAGHNQDRSGFMVFGFATGVLWNAHVAFIPITSIIVVLLIAESMHREGARQFWGSRARPLLAGVVPFVLLQIPLAIHLARHWPSPVQEYLTFSSGTGSNRLVPSLRFVASYWPTGVNNPDLALLGAVVWISLAGAMWVVSRRAGARAAGLLSVGLASTVAVFVYACVGVDDLRFRYVAIFIDRQWH